jgi:hypothetical protein
MRLLLRPKPISGESWPGYLLRLTETNSFDSVTKLARGLGKTVSEVFTSPPERILSMLQIEAPEDAAQPLSAAFPRRPSLFFSGRSLNAKLCTMCLPVLDIPYLKADWDRAFAFECRVHGVLLTEACDACGSPLTYLRTHVATCNCGFHLSHTRPRYPEAFIYGILDVLHLRATYINTAATFGGSEEQDLAAQSLLRWFARLDAGLQARERSGIRSQAYVSLDELRKVAHWFDEWPKAFIKRASEAKAGSRYSVRRRIFGHNTIDPRRFPKITEVLDANVLDGSKALKPRKNVGLETTILNSAEFVNMNFLMGATGCSYKIIRQWLRKGWLGEVRTTQWRPCVKQYCITKEAASKAIQLIRSTASVRDMAKAIGLKASQLRYLVKCGRLQGLSYGNADWHKRLVPEEVFQLATKLLTTAKFDRSIEEPRILLEAAILKLGKRSKPALVEPFMRDVLNGEISIWILDEHPTRIDQISLKVADFVSWRSKALRAK